MAWELTDDEVKLILTLVDEYRAKANCKSDVSLCDGIMKEFGHVTKYEVTFSSRDTDWEKTVRVRADCEGEALQKAANKLGYDGWYTDDSYWQYGDLYRRIDNGMSFRSGSCSCKYDIVRL